MFDGVLNTFWILVLELSYMENIKLCGSFLWIEFNSQKDTEPLRGYSLLFTTLPPGVPGTHLINFIGVKGSNNLDLEATQSI